MCKTKKSLLNDYESIVWFSLDPKLEREQLLWSRLRDALYIHVFFLQELNNILMVKMEEKSVPGRKRRKSNHIEMDLEHSP